MKEVGIEEMKTRRAERIDLFYVIKSSSSFVTSVSAFSLELEIFLTHARFFYIVRLTTLIELDGRGGRASCRRWRRVMNSRQLVKVKEIEKKNNSEKESLDDQLL